MTGWLTRREDAAIELEQIAASMMDAEEKSVVLAAQGEEQLDQVPALEDALRQAQQRANEQRATVTQVQQQIQVLAAEQRNIEEQSRGLQLRRERLHTDRNALAAPDEARLLNSQAQLAQASEAADMAEAQLHELQESVPLLDEERRAAQTAVNTESARSADLSARMEALKALQEKVKTDGKLQPWLAKHGLDGLQGLWSRLNIESGWENALEAALRERLAALEVSRSDMVRAFASDAPPAKLAFYSPATGVAPVQAAGGLKPLLSLLRVTDAAQQALLGEWLHGCLTAPTLEDALAARAQLQPGQSIFVPTGHAVSASSVSFYAPDSEQAGMLARAQEIDNFDKAAKAQALIAEQARSALVRAEAAYADASSRLVAVRREAAETRSSAHTLAVHVHRASRHARRQTPGQRSRQRGLAQARRGQQLRQLAGAPGGALRAGVVQAQPQAARTHACARACTRACARVATAVRCHWRAPCAAPWPTASWWWWRPATTGSVPTAARPGARSARRAMSPRSSLSAPST
jgi:chromosome segregation protein